MKRATANPPSPQKMSLIKSSLMTHLLLKTPLSGLEFQQRTTIQSLFTVAAPHEFQLDPAH